MFANCVKSGLILIFVIYLSIPTISSLFSDWSQLVRAINSQKHIYLSENIKYFTKNYKNLNVSSKCLDTIDKTLNAFSNSEEWVYKLFNSWSNFPPTGLLSGTLTDFGDYDQCLNIEPNILMGKSQYCLIDISIPVPKPIGKHQNFYHSVNVLPENLNKTDPQNSNNVFVKFSENGSFFYWIFIRLGICVPNKCSEHDISIIAESGFDRLGLNLKNVQCQSNTSFSLDWIQSISFSFLISSIVLSILLTLYTKIFILNEKNNSMYENVIKTFSLEINIKKLLSKQTNQEISCIHGIRVLTLFWVIFGHTIEWTFLGFYRNIFSIKSILIEPQNQPFLQAYYGVETFFFISGLFTTYITIKFTKGKYEKFNTIGFTVYRLLRLSPQLVIFILLTILLPKLGSGPIWNTHIGPIVDNCRRNWWHNILFLQTFLSIEPNEKQLNMCALHTWFIGTDMQFFLMSIPFILLLLKNIRIGFVVTSVTILLFSLLSSILVFINDYPAAHVFTTKGDFMFDDNEWNPFFKMFFWKPWPHGSVYFTGLLFGVILAKSKPIIIKKKLLIWSIISIGYIICFYDNLFWAYGQPYNNLLSSILYPLKRLIWSLNLSLIVWMCVTGNGGFVNKFLSAKVFIPLSRLTYCVYLTHAWIVWTFWASRRDLVDISIYSIISIYITILVISYILGTIFSLLYESPFLSFQSYLRKFLLGNDIKENNTNRNPEFDLNLNLISIK